MSPMLPNGHSKYLKMFKIDYHTFCRGGLGFNDSDFTSFISQLFISD